MFGEQAVLLDDRVYNNPGFVATLADMEALVTQGMRIIAPPMWALVELNPHGEVVASEYAKLAKAAGLEIIAWTLERSGLSRINDTRQSFGT